MMTWSRGVWGVAAVLVFLADWNPCVTANTVPGISVDPPEGVRVSDAGHLGQLNIQWARPASLENVTDCFVRFQLQYFDSYKNRWKAIRTTKMSFRAQFNLEKDVQVRMHTLLRGACTNGTEVHSPETELVISPSLTGPAGSRVTGFGCVFYQKEYMECTWERGTEEPRHSQHSLYYWHRDMSETQECPEYIQSHGVRNGCRFPRESLLEFSEFNVCVNGSSPMGALMPAFFSLQVQNHVKPATVAPLRLAAGSDRHLHLEWECPSGHVPGTCLEYEVETRQEGKDARERLQTNVTEETAFTFLSVDKSQRICFRVRSRVHMFCADRSFWSDWSQSKCLPDVSKENYNPQPSWDVAFVGVLVTTLIAVLVLFLALWMFWRMRKNRKEKEVFCSLYGPKEDVSTPPACNLGFH